MKNYTKIKATYSGISIYRLINDEGEIVAAFDDYVKFLIDNKSFPQTTVTNYSNAVATFIDYLTEAGVFGKAASRRFINDVINSYPQVRKKADNIRSSRGTDEFFDWAKPIVNNLNLKPLKKFEGLIAAVNLFLRRSETVSREMWEAAELLGYEKPTGTYSSLIEAVSGFEKMPLNQQNALKQVSLLEIARGRIETSRGLNNPMSGVIEPEYLDFPLDHLHNLIEAANTYRDKTLWLMLAAIGIRMSEAMNLKWSHIDIQDQKIFVHDPRKDRWGNDLPGKYQRRFKGRRFSETIFIPQLKQPLFNMLEKYHGTEWIVNNHDFVFQANRGGNAGAPMSTLTDTARIQSFKRACIRAKIPHPDNKEWTPHSLRHLYGVFLKNYYPIPGGFGLGDTEVQKAMGHKSLKATQHYAREDQIILEAKIAWADNYILQNTSADDIIKSLPKAMAAKYRQLADEIEISNK